MIQNLSLAKPSYVTMENKLSILCLHFLNKKLSGYNNGIVCNLEFWREWSSRLS